MHKKIDPDQNLALRLIVALGAYLPRVRVTDPDVFAAEQLRNKRRTRPLTGRGGYGAAIMAKFDRDNNQVEQRRAVHAQHLAQADRRKQGYSAAY